MALQIVVGPFIPPGKACCADHLRAYQTGPKPLDNEPERQVGYAGHRSHNKPVFHFDGSDLQHVIILDVLREKHKKQGMLPWSRLDRIDFVQSLSWGANDFFTSDKLESGLPYRLQRNPSVGKGIAQNLWVGIAFFHRIVIKLRDRRPGGSEEE